MDPRPDARSRRRTPGFGGAQAGTWAGRRRRDLTFAAIAPAKVNLFLHVGPVDADGYHPLASLAVFADVGDRITMQKAEALSLTVNGPFGATLRGQGDNLILKVLRALGDEAGIGEPPLAVSLEKRLPIAAGLGGGSSDAGTALRLADAALGLNLGEARLLEISRVVGADGPMCFSARTVWAQGVGDRLTPEPRLPPLHAVLVNPGRPSPTGVVYRAYDQGPLGADDRPEPPSSWEPASVIDWLAQQRNDLEHPAVALEPEIERARLAIAETGALLTRMSGSGATVFGLFEDAGSAHEAAMAIRRDHGDWWVEPAILGDDHT